jgi:hypothetical protein
VAVEVTVPHTPLHTVISVVITLGPHGGFTVTTIVTLPVHPFTAVPTKV